MAKDKIKSSGDLRVEVTVNGAPVLVGHDTSAELTSGLATWFKVDGEPVAIAGSKGPNKGEHAAPKNIPTLVPMPTGVTIADGKSWFLLDGMPVATEASKVQVPDVTMPLKNGVIEAGQTWFTVDGEPVVRGS